MPRPENRVTFIPGSVRDAIDKRRTVKELAHDENINLTGSISEELNLAIENAGQIFDQSIVDNRAWLDDKLLPLYAEWPELAQEENQEKLFNSFRDCLRKYIKQEYRLFKKTGIDDPAIIQSEEYVKEILISLILEFIYSLRVSKKSGLSLDQALRIAALSHHLDPQTPHRLIKKFPNFEPWIIARAAVHNPTNPEAFLQKIQDAIPELQAKFPNFEPGVIRYTAVHNPTNPEAFLQKVQDAIPALQAKFPNHSVVTIIQAAVFYPSDPAKFLETIVKQ